MLIPGCSLLPALPSQTTPHPWGGGNSHFGPVQSSNYCFAEVRTNSQTTSKPIFAPKCLGQCSKVDQGFTPKVWAWSRPTFPKIPLHQYSPVARTSTCWLHSSPPSCQAAPYISPFILAALIHENQIPAHGQLLNYFRILDPALN